MKRVLVTFATMTMALFIMMTLVVLAASAEDKQTPTPSPTSSSAPSPSPTSPPQDGVCGDGLTEIIPPHKTVYIEGDILDLTGLEVYSYSEITYSNGETVITSRVRVEEFNVDLIGKPLTLDDKYVNITGYSGIWPVFGRFEITVNPAPLTPDRFSDVNENDWFYNDVGYVYENSLMTGTAWDKFSPAVSLSRGMIVTILYRHAGSPDVSDLDNPFSDVTEGKYYTDTVKWAAENEIVFGYNGKFNPDTYVSRQDLTLILYRYSDFAGMGLPIVQAYPGFTDDADIADYAKEAVQEFFEAQIINGKPGNRFDPKGSATRAEAAAMLHRFLESTKD